MENTFFLNELLKNFTVSLLTVEYYAAHLLPGLSDEGAISVMQDTLRITCGVGDPQEADLLMLLEVFKSVEETVPPTAMPALSKTFNTSFQQFMAGLPIVHILGFMTGFDKAKMEALYCHTDFRHVKAMMHDFITLQMETNLVAFEACMYGQGNSYKGDGGTTSAVDVDSPQGKIAMSAMGFGDVGGDLLAALGVELGDTLSK